MSLLFRNWLDEGFYEEDEMGDLTKLESPEDISRAARSGTLYEHDGMGMSWFLLSLSALEKKWWQFWKKDPSLDAIKNLKEMFKEQIEPKEDETN